MRTFIALEIPAKEHEEIISAKLDLQSKFSNGIKWVANENLHLTLAFLGEIDKRGLKKLYQITEFIARKFNRFELKQPEIEIYPERNPKLVWIKFRQEDKELLRFVRILHELLLSNKFKIEDRDFISHITLGRIKDQIPNPVKDAITKKELITTKIELGKITIFQSILKKEGPVYKPLTSHELKGE